MDAADCLVSAKSRLDVAPAGLTCPSVNVEVAAIATARCRARARVVLVRATCTLLPFAVAGTLFHQLRSPAASGAPANQFAACLDCANGTTSLMLEFLLGCWIPPLE